MEAFPSGTLPRRAGWWADLASEIFLRFPRHNSLGSKIQLRPGLPPGRNPPPAPIMPLKSPLRLLCAAAVAPALLLSSCVYPYPSYGGYYGGPNQAAGSATGAVLGAVAGGIIGHNNCDTVGGALLGGIAGSLLGGAVGASQDRYYYGDAPMPARGYGYSYVPPPTVVVAPSYGYGYYSGGYCGPRRYYSHRSHCW
jgi:hypothetical protein